MTDDLISRMDAVQATRVGPSDEWSRDTKIGYELAATDCMMNILKVLPADLSSTQGAVAMRDVASAVVAGMAPFYIGETRFADHASLTNQIANIPLPTHAALLAAALKLPEVAALVEAGKVLAAMADRYDPPDGDDDLECWSGLAVPRIKHIRNLRTALSALEASHE
ncbi:hypothetical protein CCP3SC1AL1_470011 [Gammaproteobacteria bacterium]